VNADEQILSTLNQILDVQKQTLANQERAIEQQKVAIQRQASHLKLYRVAVIVLAPVLIYMVHVFASLPKAR
jgi:hypothetical protein